MYTNKDLKELKATTKETEEKILKLFDDMLETTNETHNVIDKAHKDIIEALDEYASKRGFFF